MLTVNNALLVLVDVQTKLAAVIHEREALLAAAGQLIRGALVLEVPVLWTEQNPKGLGPTVPELAALLPGRAIPKFSFSCWGEPAFVEALRGLGRRQVLLAGIEAHVCVCQTAADLAREGFEVQVVSDAVSSRAPSNKAVGLTRCQQAGAGITSVEAALFELLRVAEGPKFKEILKIVR